MKLTQSAKFTVFRFLSLAVVVIGLSSCINMANRQHFNTLTIPDPIDATAERLKSYSSRCWAKTASMWSDGLKTIMRRTEDGYHFHIARYAADHYIRYFDAYLTPIDDKTTEIRLDERSLDLITARYYKNYSSMIRDFFIGDTDCHVREGDFEY